MTGHNTPPSFTVVAWTQHYRRIDGAWYRDAWAVIDGQLRAVSILDGDAL